MADIPITERERRKSGLAGFDAYQVGLQFYRLLRKTIRARRGNVFDHLKNSAESVVLNVAEAYTTFGADRARRFRIAANEASECGAALDLLEVGNDLPAADIADLRSLLDREQAMLWKLSR
jgi:four helix bundle protein